MKDALIPIGEAAARFGLRTSALRYYEQIGLVMPAERRSGQRYYGESELERIALIRLCQETGIISLEDLLHALNDSSGTPDRRWRGILAQRVRDLDRQIRSARAAKALMEHGLNCPSENIFECPVFKSEIKRRMQSGTGTGRAFARRT
jgi:MerR family copper efflux transcriptional regulator